MTGLPRRELYRLAFALLFGGLGFASVGCGPSPGAYGPTLPPPPAGARPRLMALPPAVRLFALSPDRTRAAYTLNQEGGPIRLYVTTAGGESREILNAGREIERLRWNSRGDALLFTVRETRVIPGAFSDWDIPATETLAYRLMRVSAAGGEAEVLVETKSFLTFSLATQAESLVYTSEADPGRGQGGALTALDLATGAQQVVYEGAVPSVFALAPDGKHVAFDATEGEDRTDGRLRLVSLADRESTFIAGTRMREFGWLDPSRLVVAEYADEGMRQLRIRKVSAGGEAITSVIVEGEGGAYAPAIGGDEPGVSPDGKWVLANGKGEGVPLISLETGRVHRSPQFGWRGWLDAETVLGTFADGLYAVPLPAAFDLTTSAPTTLSGGGK